MKYQDYEYEVKNGEVRITKYVGDAAKVVIPASIDGLPVRILGSHMFFENGMYIERITVPGSVRVIEENACEFCFSLEELILSEGVEVLKKGFLVMTMQEELYIPASVREIEEPAEIGAVLKIAPESPYYFSDGYGLYRYLPDGGYSLELLSAQPRSSYEVPDGTRRIAKDAGLIRNGLTAVTLPESLEEIADGALFDTINGYGQSDTIKTIVIPASNPHFQMKKDGFYAVLPDGRTELLRYFGTDTVWVPDERVCAIRKRAFSGTGVRRVTILPTVTQISEDAFFDCTLEEAYFPEYDLHLYFPWVHPFLLKNILHGFGAGGKRFDFSYYDHWMREEVWHLEKLRMLICRLKRPVDLAHFEQEECFARVKDQMDTVLSLLTKEEHVDVVADLHQLGIINADNIDDVIDVFNASACRESLGYLMEAKKEYGFESFDFTL